MSADYAFRAPLWRWQGESPWHFVTLPEEQSDEIDEFVFGMAARISANSPLSISVMKEELRLLSGAHAISPELFERIQGLRRIVYDSDDYQEGLDAFRAKRKPVFCGK